MSDERHNDERLRGPRVTPHFNAANMARVLNRLYNGHVVQQAPVILPLHVYGRLKRVCDEGQHCAPLPTGYPKCPCNCGGPFGDCLR